jgi:serine/threonine protein kinase
MIGSTLDGRYEILAEIGSGQVGTVYRARHLLIGRLVAIKVLHAELAVDEKRLQNFQLEAKAVSALSHPGIIKVYDSGLAPDGRPYLVMDLAEGESLSELIARERHLFAARAVAIVAQCSKALSHAHQHGVVHRDLRPSNIILVTDGESDVVKIVDFGIACILEEGAGDARLTATAVAYGSPLYTSPELCMGRPVDAGSDIYSLGCILYEMLTGVAPFNGDSPFELASKHVAEAPRPMSEVGVKPDLPKRLELAVFKAMAKDRKKRFATINEFGEAIADALPVPVSGVSTVPAQLLRPALLSTKKAGLMAVSLVVAILTVALFFKTPDGDVLLAGWKFELLATFNHTDTKALSDSLNEIVGRSARSGDYRLALSASRRRLGLLRGQLGPQDPEVVTATIRLGELLRAAGDSAEAQAIFDWAIPRVQQQLSLLAPEGNEQAQLRLMQQLVDMEVLYPNRYGDLLVDSLNDLGRQYRKVKRYPESIDYLKRALAQREKLRGKDDLRVGETCHHLALSYSSAGEPAKALELYRRAFEIEDKDRSFEDYRWMFSDYLGFCVASQNFVEFERLWKLLAKDGRAELLSEEYLQGLAGTAAQGYVSLEKWKEAEHALDRARLLFMSSRKRNLDALLQVELLLGVVCREQNEIARAERHFKSTADLAQSLAKPLVAVNSLCGLSDLYRKQNRFDLSAKLDKQARLILEQSGNLTGQTGAGLLCRLSEDLTASGNLKEGEKTVVQCLQLVDQIPDLDPAVHAACLCARGEVDQAKGNFKEAARSYGEAAAMVERLRPSSDQAYALFLTRQGLAYTADQRFDLAERSFESAATVCRKPGYRGDKAFCLEQYRQSCLKAGKTQKAADLESEIHGRTSNQ